MAERVDEKKAVPYTIGMSPASRNLVPNPRVVQVTPEVIVDVRDGSGDSLLLTQIKLPPIPMADPEGRGRTPGQRLDELLKGAEAEALRQWEALIKQR